MTRNINIAILILTFVLVTQIMINIGTASPLNITTLESKAFVFPLDNGYILSNDRVQYQVLNISDEIQYPVNISWKIQQRVGNEWTDLGISSINVTSTSNATHATANKTVSYSDGSFLRIKYYLPDAGPIKFGVDGFVATTAFYRVVLSYRGLANDDFNFSYVDEGSEIKFRFPNWFRNNELILDYSDLPAGIFSKSFAADNTSFNLTVNFGQVNAGQSFSFDPNQITTSGTATSTAYGSQRKIFRDQFGKLIAVFRGSGLTNFYITFVSNDSITWGAVNTKAPPTVPSAVLSSSDSKLKMVHIDNSGNIEYTRYTINRDVDNNITGLTEDGLVDLYLPEANREVRNPHIIVDQNNAPMVAFIEARTGGAFSIPSRVLFLRFAIGAVDSSAEFTAANWRNAQNTSATPDSIGAIAGQNWGTRSAVSLVRNEDNNTLVVTWTRELGTSTTTGILNYSYTFQNGVDWNAWSSPLTLMSEYDTITTSTPPSGVYNPNDKTIWFAGLNLTNQNLVMNNVSGTGAAGTKRISTATAGVNPRDVTLAIKESSPSKFYIFYNNTNNDIAYQTYDYQANTWSSPETVFYDGTTENYPTAKVNDSSGRLELIWTSGSASPFTIYYDSLDVQPPRWQNNSTNSTSPAVGDVVSHNINWTDNVNLSYYIFEWNGTSGCTGGFSNVTTAQFAGGTNKSAWVNITQTIPSGCEGKVIGWRQYANDSTGNFNNTDLFTYTVAGAAGETFTRNATQSITFTLSSAREFKAQKTTTAPLSVTITPAILKQLGKGTSAGIVLIPQSEKSATFGKQTTNALDITELITSSLGRLRTVIDAIDITDNIQIFLARIRLVTDAIDLSETITRLASFTRSLNNAIDLTESITRLASFTRSLTNAIDVTETMTSTLGRLRQVTQALDITDNIQFLITRVRLITNAIDLTEAFSRLLSFTRNLANSISLTDAVTREITTPVIQRVISLGMAVTDNFTRLVSLTRSFTVAIDLAEVAERFRTLPRQVTQALDITDNIQFLITRVRLITNAIDLADTITRIFSPVRTLANAIDLTEAVQTVITRIRLTTNAIDLSETITRVLSFTRSLTNAIDLSEVATKIFTPLRQLTNAIDLTEAVQTVITRIRLKEVTNAIDLTDGLRVLLTKVRLVTNTLDVTEAMTKLISFFRAQSNALSLSPLTARIVQFNRLITQTIDVTDVGVRIVVAVTERISSLALSIADNIQKIVTNVRLTTNAIQVTELSQRILSLTKIIRNAFSLNEISTRVYKITKITINALDITEVVERIRIVSKQLTQILDVTEVISKLVNFTRIARENITTNVFTARIVAFSRTVTVSFDFITNLLSRLIEKIIEVITLPTPVPTIVSDLAPTEKLEFIKLPVLREVALGDTIVESVIVKNIGAYTLTNIRLDIGGIPKDWVKVFPKTIDLAKGETAGFTIGINVPNNADLRDYRIDMTLTDTSVEEYIFFVLRVKNPPVKVEEPIIKRFVEIDKFNNVTNIKITVNVQRNTSLVQVVEEVPKVLANSTNYIKFATEPSEIVQDDPIILWNLFNMFAGEERNIAYSVSTILKDLTVYITLPTKEINVFTELPPPQGFNLVELKVPFLSIGANNTVNLAVENVDLISHNLSFKMQLPVGWYTSPSEITETIEGGESMEYEITLFVPENTPAGNYVIKAIFEWNGQLFIREYSVTTFGKIEISKFLPVLFGLFMAASSGIAIVVIWRIRRRRHMQYRISLSEKMRKVKATLLQEDLGKKLEIQEIVNVQKLRKELLEEIKNEIKRGVKKGA